MQPVRARRLLYVSGFIRAMSTSTAGVTMGGFLGELNAHGTELGLVVSAGLAGAAVAAVLATFAADRLGRVRFLVAVSILGMAGTIAFALSSSPGALAVAAFLGMVNGMGKDRGAALILEQAVLPGLAPAGERTAAIARYTMMLDLGHALGALAAGAPAWLASTTSPASVAPHRATFLACAACGLVAAIVYLRIGSAIEVDAAPRVTLATRSRAIVVKVSSLFALDSLAGGFLTTAMLSYFFFERCHHRARRGPVPPGSPGTRGPPLEEDGTGRSAGIGRGPRSRRSSVRALRREPSPTDVQAPEPRN